ncbi:hypothetical protein BLNAU_20609 [Blattamonas nauphoetae]|uniref:Uncharacterized protein n=1 Tax=Blattamonas nauphoetae TaxID=2049346 RepID=A0ABQ9WY67_9EUKA|nr:hypothetical protein BLNAU_20609 [Blattamonas nauphoetae]
MHVRTGTLSSSVYVDTISHSATVSPHTLILFWSPVNTVPIPKPKKENRLHEKARNDELYECRAPLWIHQLVLKYLSIAGLYFD